MKKNGKAISINKKSSDLARFLQDDYENKLSSLKEKISKMLSKKYKKLYSDKNYTIKHLENDLNKLVQNVDFNSVIYDVLLKEIEKAIVEKLSHGKEITENIHIIINSSPILKKRNFINSNSSIDLIQVRSKDASIKLKQDLSKNGSSSLLNKNISPF